MPTDHLPRTLTAFVARAGAQARAERPVLVSVSEEVSAVDPLVALDAAEQAASADEELRELLRAGRMFWSRGDLALVGLGAAATIAPSGTDRFGASDRAWRTLVDGALIDMADARPPVAGPLLLGGFSFEPAGPRSDLWRGFTSTHLVVPALRVATLGHRSWLTTTVVVQRDGTLSVDLELLSRLRAIALGASPLPRGHHEPVERRLAFASVRPAAEWRGLVADAVDAIEEGAFDKVVLARAVRAVAPRAVNVLPLLDHLRAVYRDAYVFGCWRGDRAFVGASPERLVSLTNGEIEASSLAGSARRGATPEEDAALAAALQTSAKELAEHAMVRRALRDALSTLCDDVTSRDEPSLLTLPNVHHLHTAVRARLRAGRSLLDVAAVLHPTPAVGGAPREPALRFIREREPLDRGWYAAPIGWIGRDGGELAVALRSALIAGREATLFAGCGIVAGSDPERELAESEVKLRAMQSALAATLGTPAPDRAAATTGASARDAWQ